MFSLNKPVVWIAPLPGEWKRWGSPRNSSLLTDHDSESLWAFPIVWRKGVGRAGLINLNLTHTHTGKSKGERLLKQWIVAEKKSPWGIAKAHSICFLWTGGESHRSILSPQPKGSAWWGNGATNEKICVEWAAGKSTEGGGIGRITHNNGVVKRGTTTAELPKNPQNNQGRQSLNITQPQRKWSHVRTEPAK